MEKLKEVQIPIWVKAIIIVLVVILILVTIGSGPHNSSESSNDANSDAGQGDYAGFSDKNENTGAYKTIPGALIDDKCRNNLWSRDYGVAGVAYTAAHQDEAYETGQYSKNGHLIWLMRGAIKTPDDKEATFVCYITNEENPEIFYLAVGNKTILGQLDFTSYDKDGNKKV